MEYVHRLKWAVGKHLPRNHRFVCITDNPGETGCIETSSKHLPGWWAKMRVFEIAATWGERVLYLDLDTVIVGDIAPLADLDVPFGICENFTRLSVNPTWPCKFGSCAMTLAPGFGGDIWDEFHRRRHELELNRYGDQKVIEILCDKFRHTPALLQDVLPSGFFLGYRDLPANKDKPPKGTVVVVFAGHNKPHNTECKWAKEAWVA